MISRQALFVILISLSKGHCLATNTPHQGPKVITSRKDEGHSTSCNFIFDQNRIIKEEKHKEQNQANVKQQISSLQIIRRTKSAIKTTFLPSGFPQRTPKGYLSYSMWSWIQDLSTQLRGVLATQRVLEGIGVGREGATALSASLNFIVRDGCGMASTLLFTAMVSSKFRADVKRWRILADIMNDVGITLEVAATLVPRHLFLAMICAGNMCKAICGVAAGACNGAINLHWAKGSDISDVNAKFGAQHTITASLGLIFAAMFARSVSSVPNIVLWSLYTLLTFLHIFANLRCVRLIAFDYLNTNRMNLIVNDFLSKVDDLEIDLKNEKNTDGAIISLDGPMLISRREPFLFGDFTSPSMLRLIPIRMGSSFERIQQAMRVQKDSASLINVCINQMSQDNYFVVCGMREIFVALCSNPDPKVKAKAYFNACIMRKILIQSDILRSGSKSTTVSLLQVHNDTSHKVERLWPLFVENVSQAGWDLTKTELSTDGYCVSISDDKGNL